MGDDAKRLDGTAVPSAAELLRRDRRQSTGGMPTVERLLRPGERLQAHVDSLIPEAHRGLQQQGAQVRDGAQASSHTGADAAMIPHGVLGYD